LKLILKREIWNFKLKVIENSKADLKNLCEVVNQRKHESNLLGRPSEEWKIKGSGLAALESKLRLKTEQYQQALIEMENLARSKDIYKVKLEKLTGRDMKMQSELLSQDVRLSRSNVLLNDNKRFTKFSNA